MSTLLCVHPEPKYPLRVKVQYFLKIEGNHADFATLEIATGNDSVRFFVRSVAEIRALAVAIIADCDQLGGIADV
jgi:hypothetical protein